MGSDFMFAFARAPHTELGSIDAMLSAELQARIGKMRAYKHVSGLTLDELSVETDAVAFEADPEIFDDGVDTASEEYLDALRPQYLEQLLKDVDLFLDDRRDISGFTLHEEVYYITGGMSWGDDPTDAYFPIQRVDIAGIFDEPITEAEFDEAILP